MQNIPSRKAAVCLTLTTLVSAACMQAPEFSGSNQVPDVNVTRTTLKDNHFEKMSWEDVDNLILDQLVPNPESEPGCAVGIVRDGQIIYLQGYGNAEIDQDANDGENSTRPWSVSTMGAVGSISKTITAAALLSMVDDGDLSLGDRVDDHLVTFNAPLANRTLESLLTHSSGIGGPDKDFAFSPKFEPLSGAANCQYYGAGQPAGYCDDIAAQIASPKAAFDMYEANEMISDLGAIGVYSNVGYSVAGAVIDQVAQDSHSNQGYEAYVWNEIGEWSNNPLEGGHINSLALTHSWRDTDIPNRAIGYGDSPSFPVFEAWQDAAGIEGWVGPSGGWAMTIGDLARFMIGLNESEFFEETAGEPSLLDLMRQNHTTLASPSSDYGMGMFLGEGTREEADFRHGGDIAGHHASWAWWDRYEGHNIGIGLMCNRGDLLSSTLYSTMIWESGDATEETLLWLALNQSPDPISEIAFGPISEDDAEGAAFELLAEQAWLVGGQQLALPVGLLDLDLFLSVESFQSGAGGPIFEFGQGTIGSNGEPQVPNPVELTSLEYENPSFATKPVSLTLGGLAGSIDLQKMVIEGAFGEDGKSLEAVALSGLLDTRQADQLGYEPTGRDACRDIRLAGGECVPCEDGEPLCLEIRYENLSGVPVPEPGFAAALLLGAGMLIVTARRR